MKAASEWVREREMLYSIPPFLLHAKINIFASVFRAKKKKVKDKQAK